MDCNFPHWWLTVLLSLSTLAESRFGQTNSPATLSGGRYVQPQLPASQQLLQQQQHGAHPRPVVVNCHPNSMRVVVQADMFGMGLQVDGRHLRLGSDSVSEGSACGAVPSGEAEFTIQASLRACGARLSSTKEKIIYSNVLVYSPEPSAAGLLRLAAATIPVQCHYEKRYAVAALSMHPTWIPLVSSLSAEDHIAFNLLVMTDDWQFQRGSFSFFLGDPIHFEISVFIGNHVSLRVYVDNCVATATPDAQDTLRYDFIENYGCLADTRLTNSSSRFLPRVEDHKLRFQLEAFRFYHESNNQIYITCYLKAVPVGSSVDSQNRACSIIENRWRSVDGNDQACRSCSSYWVDEPTETPKNTISTQALPTKTSPEEKSEQHSANYFRFRPGMLHSQQLEPQPSSTGSKRRERSVQFGPITVLPNFHKTT
ncbi:zona pellucida sperm-binding protein 3-like [Pungitius pungitius]|uniref:zona pellucida sperm-binding protein 3-like n=1 Tax=Pungitius pungitius TaxID=134920 RepID=UPI002E11EE03